MAWFWILDLVGLGLVQSTVVASRVKEIRFPSKLKFKPKVKNVLGEKNGFARIKAGHRDSTGFMHSCAGLSEINMRRLEKVRKNGGNRLDFADIPELQLNCYVDKDKSFLDNFGRLSWDKPSPTITTKFYTISCGRFAHPEENRPLSLREGASLQTFPKTYGFYGTSVAIIAKLIGNAVPPKYANLLGRAIIE